MTFEITFYMTSMFSDIGDEKIMPMAMKFRSGMQAQPHYIKNKEKLEGLPVLFPEFPEELHVVMKKLWVEPVNMNIWGIEVLCKLIKIQETTLFFINHQRSFNLYD